MNRRNFLKIAGITAVGLLIGKPVCFAKKYSSKMLEIIRKGKYPGEIKTLNEKEILKEGNWSG